MLSPLPSSTPARSTLSALSLLALLAAGCGSGETGDATGTPGADPDAISFQVETTVAPGNEVQLCKFVAMPTDRGEIAVNRTEHTYTEGSHHFLVYRTTYTAIPEGGEVLVGCDETDWMSTIRGVAYGAQEPKGDLTVPEGVAARFTPGEVLLVQTHYLNTTGEDLHATVDFTFHAIPVESAPTEVGVLFFFNPIIDVPPHGSSKARLSCPISDDIHLVFASSHMHKRGVGYEAHVEGQPDGSLYETDKWAEPVPRTFSEKDGLLTKGSQIPYTCSFDNGGDARYIAGPSAEKDEMCMFVGMYYPRVDADTELCWSGAVDTQGTESCLDTLSCLGGCAEEDTDCKATCFNAICPTAAQPLMRFGRCLGPACGEICKEKGADDPACTSCVISKCATEASACQAAVCATP